MGYKNISNLPHIHSPDDIPWIMRQVIYALLPGALIGVYFFGLPAIKVIIISMVSCVVIEALIQKLMKKDITTKDGSAAVTGMLLAMNLPAGVSWWVVVIGSVIAIIFGKQIFGGIGNNIFNPTLVARVFLMILFPMQMTSWPMPRNFFSKAEDALTGATPLGALKTVISEHQVITASTHLNLMDSFMGNIGGSLGEISSLALIIGGLYLITRKITSWHIPVFYLGSVALMTWIFWCINPVIYADPLFHLLTGGLMLGAFFMATDIVTSPVTKMGKSLFGIGCGVFTVIIRNWSTYPEGVAFAILFMNAFVPMINRATIPAKAGA